MYTAVFATLYSLRTIQCYSDSRNPNKIHGCWVGQQFTCDLSNLQDVNNDAVKILITNLALDAFWM